MPITHPAASRLDLLDVLRFGAAVVVVAYHFGFRGWLPDASAYMAFPWAGHVFKYGYLGVDAFFLISGFVILMTALHRSPRDFAFSRIVRLYPAYWCSVVVAFVVHFLLKGRDGAEAWMVALVNLTMFQEFLGVDLVDGVYWTLAIELRFYLLVLLLSLTGLLRRIEPVLWLWLAVLLLHDRQWLILPTWLDQALLRGWAHYFIAGATFYLVWQRGLTVARSALLVLCLLRAMQHAYWFMLLKGRLTGIPMNTIVVVTCVLGMFVLFTAIATRAVGPLDWRWAPAAGALTYPLYLIHESVGSLVFYPYLLDSRVGSGLQLLGAILLAIAAAWGLWRGVERPLAAWLKRRLMSPGGGMPAAA